MTREQIARLAALGALAAAVVAVLVVLLSGSATYVVHADFFDAGQLVRGDLVTVAGHQVGSIGSITLTKNGLADVALNIDDQGIAPLHAGARATIGQLSLTGVANRFVGLTLTSAGRAIPSGGTLAVTQTRGIVDLDVLLDALTPRVRVSLQRILASGARLVAQPTARQLNHAAPYANPALAQTAQLGSEVMADKFALQRLITSTAQVASSLAARNGDLAGAVTNTAATLRTLASERTALADAVARAPGFLAQSTGVLRDARQTLTVLDPALRSLQPVAPRLAQLLRVLVPAGRNAIPTIAGVQALVPSAEAALRGLPPVEREATPAVRSLTAALGPLTPILAGLRPYAPDVVAGFFNGVGGATGGSYDANGHYLKAIFTAQGGGASLSGVLSLLGGVSGTLGPFNGERTHLLAPCPGGGSPAAPDGSNPWTTPDVLAHTGNLCNPADDQR